MKGRGGAYKDKGQVQGGPDKQGFLNHGRQSNIDYVGIGDGEDDAENSNATTGG